MIHFKHNEFFKSGETDDIHVHVMVDWWKQRLSLHREILGQGVTITDGYRPGTGTSQHHFTDFGAVDSRPRNVNDKQAFITWGLLLASDPQITRVCFYTPSDRFTWGGFHADCKTDEKKLYVNMGEEINWVEVNLLNFTRVLMETYG